MADTGVFSGSFGSGTATTPAWRKKLDEEDPNGLNTSLFGSKNDVQQSNLFQSAAQTATGLMQGGAPEFDAQANIARDAQKVAQAQAATQKRQQLMNAGMRDTGTYLQEGIINPADQQERERVSLERDLSATRQQLVDQRRAQGLTSANQLLGLASGENQARIGATTNLRTATMQDDTARWKQDRADQLTREGMAQDAAQAQAERESRERIATLGSQTDVQIAGMNINQDQWKILRAEELTKSGWSIEDARAQAERESRERIATLGAETDVKIAGMNIGSAKELAQMNINQDQWRQLRTEELTKLGWSEEAARQQAQIESNENIAKMNIQSSKELATMNINQDQWKQARVEALTREGWANEAAQAQVDREWQTVENNAQRDFTREMTTMGYDVEKWKTLRSEELTKAGWADDAARQQAQIESNERIANMNITSAENLAQMNISQEQWKQLRVEQLTKQGWDADAARQASQQEWQSVEADRDRVWKTSDRQATQAWQTGERIDTQNFQKFMSEYDAQKQLALQNNQYDRIGQIEDKKAALQLQMQTQEMAQDEKMLFLKDQLDTARAEGDTKRQMQILGFQHTQEMEKIAAENGYEQANMYLRNEFARALQDDDQIAQESLLKLRLTSEAEERAKDRLIDEKRLALEGKQIDMQGQQMTFDQIQAGIENGSIDAASGAKAIQDALAANGIQVEPPDVDAWKTALDNDYKQQMYQWGQTHEGTWDDAKGTLKPEATTEFNKFVNGSVYGNPTITQYLLGEKTPEELRSDLPALQVLQGPSESGGAPEWDPTGSKVGFQKTGVKISLSGVSASGHDVWAFNNPLPAVSSYIKVKGTLYYVESIGKSPSNTAILTLKNASTGELVALNPQQYQ